ncbi:aldehyde dehydrogenase family protein [Paenarthrobacter ureafaciens]|uniref:aldehyde dehydrogenase family protein n=1 Tax=Paenarthrobacter ureafaciens TaxID=37931 RepID=UPI001FB52238|nr:aldehyde dehydrogenase family protein [Paenarthrobacter ureafaciens]UOD81781.1 aldehyde dehydrogenase family protein [Paenarthrobacter ureafaciens]WNZ05272.1 aldehyde dehydrogenase family protein [Paenarthrobacter ureafaciens]
MSETLVETQEGLYINGQWRPGENGHVEVMDPTTEEIVGTVAEATAQDAAEAAAAARAAQPGWAAMKPERRAEIFTRVAHLVTERADMLIELTMREGGFTRAMAGGFGARANEWFTTAAEATVRNLDVSTPPQLTPKPDGTVELLNGQIQRRPAGVVAALIPFNGPLFGASMKSAQALAMGNTVVLKPAPQNPLAVIELFKIFEEAGMPPGVANLVTASDPEVGATLTRSRDVDLVSFTGSTAVGRAVYAAGSQTMKRMVLELGGKGACIVFEDADLEAAVKGISNTWTVNTGQICSAPTRAIVHRSVYEEVLERLEAVARAVPVGSPFDPDTVAGPVISGAQRQRIETLVDSARGEGASIAAGGTRPDIDRGFFVAPTLIANCTNQMRVAREEIFGPVVSVIPFSTQDEAVAIANDSDFGLSSYIYSRDTARAYQVAGQLQAGTIQINTTSMKLDLPRGGVKMSGIGREGGQAGLEEMTELHCVVWS